jgi:hypothetical protein
MHHSRTIDDGIAQLAKEMAEKNSASEPALERFGTPVELVGGDD